MVSSPDLKQSVSYALTPEQIQQYHQDGFLIVRNFFSSEEIEPLLRSLSTHSNEYASGEIRALDNTGKPYSIIYWTELGESLLGVFPRVARMVEGAEALLGEPCYHWHSKVCRKLPNSGQVEWHQDYGSWYHDGCISPFIQEGQEHHHYRPLQKLPNSVIIEGNYHSAMEDRAEVYKPDPEIDRPYMNILPLPRKK